MSIEETIEALEAELALRTQEADAAMTRLTELDDQRVRELVVLRKRIAALEAVAGTVGDKSADLDRAWEALPKDMAHEICEERGYGVRGNLPAGVDLVVAHLREAQQERDAAQEKADSWERWAHEKAPEVERLAARVAGLDAGIQSALAAVPDDIADAAGGELIPAIERLTKHYFRLHGKVHDACQALPDDIRIAADGDLVAGVKGLEAAYQVERKAVEDHARELAQMRQVNAELREMLIDAGREIQSLRTYYRDVL